MPKPSTKQSAPPLVDPSDTLDASTHEPAPFLRCKCIGALPGRCCPRCSGTRWLKRCEPCNGSGLLFKNVRRGAEPRSERCGRCVGNGWISSMPADRAAIAEFVAAHPDAAAA